MSASPEHKPTQDLDDLWKRVETEGLEPLLDIIIRGGGGKMGSKSVYSIFTAVDKFSWASGSGTKREEARERRCETLRKFLVDYALPDISAAASAEDVLQALGRWWTKFKILNKYTNKMCFKLNFRIAGVRIEPSLEQQGIAVFHKEIFLGRESHVVAAFLGEVQKERDGESVNQEALRSAVEVMHVSESSVYGDALEGPYLEQLEAFLMSRVGDWLAQSPSDFVDSASEALEREIARVDSYLLEQTKSPVVETFVRSVLDERFHEKLKQPEDGLSAMFTKSETEKLRRALRLLLLTGDEGAMFFAGEIHSYITSEGIAILKRSVDKDRALLKESSGAAPPSKQSSGAAPPSKSSAPPSKSSAPPSKSSGRKPAPKPKVGDEQLVRSLWQLHAHMTGIVAQTDDVGTADNRKTVHRAMMDAMSEIMNRDQPGAKFSVLEQLAGFVDKVMQGKTADKLTEDMAEELLGGLLSLVKFIKEYDRFALEYSTALSKRLLNGTSTSRDLERFFITGLKSQRGASYTSKLEMMLKDIDASREDLTTDFAAWLTEHGRTPPFTFQTVVLTTNTWPSFAEVALSPPEAVKQAQDAFAEFYRAKFENRSLSWMYSSGQAELTARFVKPFTFVLTPVQAATLVHFNNVPDGEFVSFEAICEALEYDEEVGKRTLHSLACMKHRVLIKDPPSKRIGTKDKFSVNVDFHNPRLKFGIPMASLHVSTHSTSSQLDTDRRNVMDATIVRIMKARKTLDHNQLLGEVVRQITLFQPNPKAIKQRIEGLIDSDYLERDEKNRDLYHYLA